MQNIRCNPSYRCVECSLTPFDCVIYKRYEGEWLQNNMDGHGVVEVDIPRIEPVPGSKYVNGPPCMLLAVSRNQI